MKTFSSLLVVASVAALVLSPVSLELAVSLFVALGVIGLVARDYSRPVRQLGAGV